MCVCLVTAGSLPGRGAPSLPAPLPALTPSPGPPGRDTRVTRKLRGSGNGSHTPKRSRTRDAIPHVDMGARAGSLGIRGSTLPGGEIMMSTAVNMDSVHHTPPIYCQPRSRSAKQVLPSTASCRETTESQRGDGAKVTQQGHGTVGIQMRVCLESRRPVRARL